MPPNGRPCTKAQADVRPRAALWAFIFFIHMSLIYSLYCRTSSLREDKQTLGNPAQERVLLEEAAKKNLKIGRKFIEKQSAYTTGRPEFNEMLDQIEKGKSNAIFTYHLTRLARNSFDGGRIIYMIDQGLIKEIRTPEKIYTDNSDDKFLMQIHFAMAKKSSDDTSQFVTRDVESKLLKGEYPGMVPIGYLNIDKDGNITKAQKDKDKYLILLNLGRPLKREEIDPVDGQIVRRFFEEAVKGGRALPALRKMSFALGLRSRKAGKILSRKAVWNLLTNPYYYGAIEYNGKIYTENIQHEPLISKELFDRVQDVLHGRARGRYRKHAYAYGGCIIRCGGCGGPVTAERQKGVVYYHCTGNSGACDETAWTREDLLDQQFLPIITNFSIPQNFLKFAFKKVRILYSQETQVSEASSRKLRKEYDTHKQRLDALLQLKLSSKNIDGNLLSDDEYLAQKAVIKKEMQDLEELLHSRNSEDLIWIDDCERFFDFTQSIAKKF
ncbi:MAG: resolvase domain-containing protein, partial [Candidatus Peregrinibacteria bacterium Greene0416_62]